MGVTAKRCCQKRSRATTTRSDCCRALNATRTRAKPRCISIFYGSEPNMPAVFAYVQARFCLKATGCTVDEKRCDVAARFGRGADSQVVSREGDEKLVASMPSRLPCASKTTPSSHSPITILCAAANRHSADAGLMIRTHRNALPAHSYGHFGSGSTREKFAQFRLENCVNPIVPTVHSACRQQDQGQGLE